MMSDNPPENEPGPSRSRGPSFGRIVAVLAVLGFVVWFGVRVRVATGARDALATERQQFAEAARKAAEPGQVRKVAVVRGIPDTWLPSVPFDGTLSPVQEADLGFKISGNLQGIRVHLGQGVKSGALLASLDASEASAAVDSAAAQIRASEAQLLLAQDAERRSATLLSRGAGTPASSMQAAQQRALFAAQMDSARAQLHLAQVSRANLALMAPFGGVITKVPSGAGTIVNPGQALFHLQDIGTLKLAGTVGETDARLVRVGARVVLRSGDSLITDPKIGPRTGKITAVLPGVDPATRRVPVEAELPNRDGALLAGAFVHALVEGEAPVPVLRLPPAVLRPGSQDEVMVVKERHLFPRRITFAPGAAGAFLVLKGLLPDDDVMLGPSAEAREGDLVDPAGPAMIGQESTP